MGIMSKKVHGTCVQIGNFGLLYTYFEINHILFPRGVMSKPRRFVPYYYTRIIILYNKIT